MAINYVALKTAIAEVIKTLTDQTVIWSNQNANTPSGDFLTMKLSSLRKNGGNDWEGKPDSLGISKTQGDREIVLSVISVSVNSMQILADLIDKIELSKNLELLTSKKLAYVGLDGDIVDITTQINNSFETRAVAELIFRISKNYSTDTENEVEIVESVGITGELTGNGLVDPVEVDSVIETD